MRKQKLPKLPSNILIGNVRYQIEDLPSEKVMQGVEGECSNVYHHTIRIDPALHGEQATDTLLHECLHAADDIHRLHLSHKQIYRIAAVLAELFAYNPALLHWMQKTNEYSDLLEHEE